MLEAVEICSEKYFRKCRKVYDFSILYLKYPLNRHTFLTCFYVSFFCFPSFPFFFSSFLTLFSYFLFFAFLILLHPCSRMLTYINYARTLHTNHHNPPKTNFSLILNVNESNVDKCFFLKPPGGPSGGSPRSYGVLSWNIHLYLHWSVSVSTI